MSRLVVVGRQPLEELEAIVREKFSAVLDTGIEPPSFSVSFGLGGESFLDYHFLCCENGIQM